MKRGLFIAAIIFIIDLFCPRGICLGVMHILAVMSTLTSPRRQATLVVATVSMIFVLVAEVFAPVPLSPAARHEPPALATDHLMDEENDIEPWKIAFNRALTVGAIWGTAFVIYLRGKALDQLDIVSRQLHSELNYASRLQKKLYPDESPHIPGIDVSGTVLPAEQLCGDYFDYLEMAGGTYGFVVGDVSGHGIGQSLIMSEVRSELRSLVKAEDDLGKILHAVNIRLLDDAPDEIFVTLLLVQLDPQSMTFRYAAAGHCGLLLRANGECQELRSDSLALGLIREAKYTTHEPQALNVGDMLLLSTDGLEERHSPDSELFGRERVICELRACVDASAKQVVQRLIDAATNFARGQDPHDDVTVLVIRRTGEGTAVDRAKDGEHTKSAIQA